MIEYTVKVFDKRNGNDLTEWYLNGQLHREDGPAVHWKNGSYEYYVNGKLHREDGPAREYGGRCEWYIKDKRLTEEQFNDRNKTCNGTIIEFNGKKYKLVEV